MISSSINLIMTVLGFAVSSTFIVFVCTRLMCARRTQQRRRRAMGVLEINVNSFEDGMEPNTVISFPTIKYTEGVFPCREDAVCAVCLSEYSEKEALRVLPWCGHAFHIECIDSWLRQQSTCPICRVSLRESPDGRAAAAPFQPQMNPPVRWFFTDGAAAAAAVGAAGGGYGGADAHNEADNSTREQRSGKWSFRLWRRPVDSAGNTGAQALPYRHEQQSSLDSVTININIGHLPDNLTVAADSEVALHSCSSPARPSRSGAASSQDGDIVEQEATR